MIMHKEIQENNEAMFEEILLNVRYLFARGDLKDRTQKTSQIVDYLNKQLGLDK